MLNPSLKDLDLSSEELKEFYLQYYLREKEVLKAIKACLKISALILSKPVRKGEKPKINFSKARIEKIRKEFNKSRHKFYKSKINKIRRNLYEIKNKKNLFALRMEEIKKKKKKKNC